MGIQGVEFVADTAVAQDAIRDAGFGFVVGHLGTGSAGQLTATRAQDYIAAGLSIVSVYDAPQQPLDGTPIGYDPGLFEDPASVLHGVVYRAGVIDGRSAYGLATSVGQAAGSAIYFEVDADVNAGADANDPELEVPEVEPELGLQPVDAEVSSPEDFIEPTVDDQEPSLNLESIMASFAAVRVRLEEFDAALSQSVARLQMPQVAGEGLSDDVKRAIIQTAENTSQLAERARTGGFVFS